MRLTNVSSFHEVGMSREAVWSWEEGPGVEGHEIWQRIPLGMWACGPVWSGH